MCGKQITNIYLLLEGSCIAFVLDGNRKYEKVNVCFFFIANNLATWSTTGNVSLTLGAHQEMLFVFVFLLCFVLFCFFNEGEISQLSFLIPKSWTIEELTDFWKLRKSLLISRYFSMLIISFLCLNPYAQISYFYFFFCSFKRRFLPEISIIVELKLLIPSLSGAFSHAKLRISLL